MAFDLAQLKLPIVQAPMAGGPSTPELAVAVCEAGGLGFLAAGYRSAQALATDVAFVRELTERPLGVNIFSPPDEDSGTVKVGEYAHSLSSEAERYGVSLGEPRLDDDDYDAKLDVVVQQDVDVVSFTFGCPAPATVNRLHSEDVAVWVTVTSPAEAHQAEAAGADALIVQGTEAGGHRAYFHDDLANEEYGLVVLLRLLAGQTSLPLVATGGIMDGSAIAAVLCAGASGAQLGSALMLTPEAGTTAPHRSQLDRDAPTRLTRAFSGRRARGIVNRFMEEHDAHAPSAYPQVHHLTVPIRAAAREAGDAQAINLWAGQGHELARQLPVAELLRQFMAEAAVALRRAGSRITGGDD